jgi:prepilin peptidase CpaA
MPSDNLFLAGLVVLSAAAAFHDSRSGLIPNRLLASAAGLGFAGRVVAGSWSHGWAGAGASALSAIVGLVVCALVPVLLYRAGGIGGGDVKLLAVVGLAIGPMWGLEAEFYSFAALLLYAPARLAYDGRLFRVLSNSLVLVANPLMPKAKRRPIEPELMASFRFGPAVFVGTVAVTFMHWRLR